MIQLSTSCNQISSDQREMLRSVLSLSVLLLCIVQIALGTAQQGVNPGEAKLKQIRDLAAKSKGNVITLDDSTYNYYATSKPRPYTLMVFLTAAHPKFKCAVCKEIDSEFTTMAESYAAGAKRGEEQKDIFFLRLDYENSQKVFQNYRVNSVPLLFHLAPHQGTEKPGAEYQISPRDRYQVPTHPDAESLASFLNDRANVSIKIERSKIVSYIILLVVFAILAALVQPVIYALPVILKFIQWKPLWIVVSLGIYTCAISGLIYDIIRSPQMYHADPRTGQINFFYPQSGSQFVVEGFVIGFLNLGCAASLAVVLMFAPYFKSEQNRTMGLVGGIVGFLVCFRLIRSLYIMKNQWYGRAF